MVQLWLDLSILSPPYNSRLEMLQQIANRVQRDCVAGEDKLALARTSLQSVSPRTKKASHSFSLPR